ncbi:MAG: hypothetical protein WA977_05420 [Halobacteriota archaeon]
MQTSEQIESDVDFLRLFSHGALDLLSKEDLWNRVHIIRSSPGGGKTSLLRLFTPGSLLTLHAHRGAEEFKELYLKMKELGAITEKGPKVLGVLLSCSKNYDLLEDLNFEEQYKRRLLHSLLDSRIILTALRGILDLKRLEYPADLDKISFKAPEDISLPQGIPRQCNGRELFNWASNVERAVYEAIDSFEPINSESLVGYGNLVSPFMLKSDNMLCDNQPVTPYILIMLDDCHKLTQNQRSSLISIIDERPPVGVWIAERLEALKKEELLSLGAESERDVVYIDLEKEWRSRGGRFTKTALNIADRRAQFANVEIQSFSACLQDVLDNPIWSEKIENAIDTISERIRNRVGESKTYKEWINSREIFNGVPIDTAIRWRSLEIILERDLGQKKLSDFVQEIDFAYDIEELEKRDDYAVKASAGLFLSREFGFPYYFNFTDRRLASMASSNIEQFIWLGASLFEEVISARLIDPNALLSPERQEDIIKKTIEKRWKEIPYTIRNGRDVMKFLEAIGKMAIFETMKPNAPYAPGVTGIAISMRARETLIQDKKYSRLFSVLSECIAHNLLEPVLDCKCKGERWMVLYLNRMLCVRFGLPLQYGGFREKTLSVLTEWMERGFIRKRNGRKKT